MIKWEYFWLITIVFSIVSFTYMSAKAIIKGLGEMKEMFAKLQNPKN